MTDTNDTSVGLPQNRADDPGDDAAEGASRSFFSRIIDRLTPQDTAEDTSNASTAAAVQGPMPGMGNLRRLRVEDVAIPKADIVAAPISLTKADLVAAFRDSGLTRIPVYDGTLDTPVGLINLKDFALRHGFDAAADFDLRGMLRPLLYVPPSMPLGVLLQKMQADRIHMALVIDEYGGTDGLVTIEDLLEQVVGDIDDEHDEAEVQTFVKEKPGVWLALAKTPLEEFEAAIGMNLTAHAEIDEEEIDTLGGLVAMLAGHVPARGEVIKHPDGPEFEVIDADPRRIKRLRVRMPSAEGA
jgi:magnesium and cobalt transporter